MTHARRSTLGTALAAWLTATIAMAPTRADDGSDPAPSPQYADKPAEWWIEQLEVPTTNTVAREALKVVGAPALPALLRALGGEKPGLRRAVALLIERFPGNPAEDSVPFLARALEDREPDVFVAAARVARRLNEKGAPLVAALAARTSDPSERVQIEALSTLAALGSLAKDAVPVLSRLVSTSSPVLRSAVIAALGVIGPDAASALPALVAALDGAQTPGALALVHAIGRIGPRDATALAALRRAGTSDAASIRGAVSEELARCARVNPDAVEAFLALLHDPDPAVRRSGVQALLPIDDLTRAAIPALLDTMFDADNGVRSSARNVVANLGREMESSIPRLVELHEQRPESSPLGSLLSHWGNWAGSAVVKAYGAAGPRARALLDEHLLRFDPKVIQSATALLMPGAAADLLSAGSSPDTKRRAAGLLGVMAGSDPSAIAPLLGALGGDDDVAAASADEALTRLPAAHAGLLDLLASDRPSARRRALDLLMKNGVSPEERAVIGRLLADPVPDIRQKAAFAVLRGVTPFSRSGSELGVPVEFSTLAGVLTEALSDPAFATRWQAARCLGSLAKGAKDQMPALVMALSDVDRTVARAAAEAVLRVANAAKLPVEAAIDAAITSTAPLGRVGGALALALAGGRQRSVLLIVEPLLNDADARVRSGALDVIAVLGPDAGLLLARVHALLSDPDASVSAAAKVAMDALRRAPK